MSDEPAQTRPPPSRAAIRATATAASAALAFGGAAILRLHLQFVESRFQIAGCWIALAALVLAIRRWRGTAPSTLSVLLVGGAATIGIVLAKWSIEGLPPALGA